MERIAVRRALKIAKNPVVTERPRDVSFSVDVPEELLIGKNVNLSVNVNNKSDRKLTVASHVNAQVVRYTGVILKKLKRQQEKVEVSAKGSRFLILFLLYSSLYILSYLLGEIRKYYCLTKH